MRKPDKSLAEKWGIMPWLKIRIDNDPAWLRELVEPLCEDTKMARQGVCDIAFVAPTSAAEWKQKARRLKLAIDPDGDEDEEYEKKVMTIAHKENCVGCEACSKVCPKKCYTHEAVQV